ATALSSDKLEDYNRNVMLLKDRTEKLQQAFAKAPSWRPLVEKLSTVLPAGSANDLADARKAFLPFTAATVELAKIARQKSTFRSVKIYKCPMAPKPGQTSFWLQLVGPLRNPFYGAEMID